MSYQRGTTHYNLPQTIGTDKRDWSDTNQAFTDVDAALYAAAQDASTAATAVTELDTRLTTQEGKMSTAEGDIADLQASDTTQDTAILNLQNAVTNLQEVVVATVTTDGVETMSQTYNRLFALVPSNAAFDEMRYKIVMTNGDIYYNTLYSHTASQIIVTATLVDNGAIHTDTIRMKATGSTREVGHLDGNGYTYIDRSSQVFDAGTVISLIVR